MRKAWKIVGIFVLVFLLLGILCIGIGFFTGSSPVVIQTHGSLAPYLERLEINRDILLEGVQSLLHSFGF